MYHYSRETFRDLVRLRALTRLSGQILYTLLPLFTQIDECCLVLARRDSVLEERLKPYFAQIYQVSFYLE